MMQNYPMAEDNLLYLLAYAINKREQEEKRMGYHGDSAMLVQWKQAKTRIETKQELERQLAIIYTQ